MCIATEAPNQSNPKALLALVDFCGLVNMDVDDTVHKWTRQKKRVSARQRH